MGLNYDLDSFANIKEFYALYQQLMQQRRLRGSIEFETTETRMVFDDPDEAMNAAEALTDYLDRDAKRETTNRKKRR